MKPDWDKLATEFKDSSTVLVADVDCTAAGKPLCDKHGVKGFPTIKTFRAGDTDGEDYEGGRDFDSLKKHTDSLGPSCHIDRKELCSAEQIAMLEKYAAMSPERRKAKITKLTNAIQVKEAAHEKLQKELSASYEASNAHLEKLRE